MTTLSATMLGRNTRRRFSLLLLDHGELYLEDHGCFFHPASSAQASLLGLRTTKKLKGRLRVASSSLTFEPEDTAAPLMRVLLRELVGMDCRHAIARLPSACCLCVSMF